MSRDEDPAPTFADLDALMAGMGVERDPKRGRGASAPEAPKAAPKGARQGELEGLRETLERLRTERDALRTERDALRADHDALRAERDALRAERGDTIATRERLDRKVRALQRRLEVAPKPPPASGEPISDLLAARGVRADERASALRALLEGHEEALFDALPVAPVAAFTTLLDRRLALSCGCQDLAEAAVLRVPPDRCEICGGSSAGRAFHTFVAACHAARLRRVVVVGGSPAYRRELRKLADPRRDQVRFEWVPGRQRPPARKVRGHARNADLVLIWCATILDHATTNAYQAAGARTLLVPHRGIATMLTFAAAALQQEP